MIAIDTEPGSRKPNEDWVGATPDTIVVLDGLSAPEGVGGCHHGTPWYVARLGERLLIHASNRDLSLRDALAHAITEVASLHADSCDLTDPGTPSSTVAVVRTRKSALEALVLADSPVVIETPHGPEVLTDPRVEDVVAKEREAALTAGPGEKTQRLAELVRAQRAVRNTPNGYWIAQATADAAAHAITKDWPVRDVARATVMTDGASCLVDTYQLASWGDLLTLLSTQGPRGVINRVREAEATDPDGRRWPRYKASDDIAIAYWDTITCPLPD